MENFIFILIAIAIFGYKQYQKSMKKNNEIELQNIEANPKVETSSIENIEKEIEGFVNNFFGEKEFDSEIKSEVIDNNVLGEESIIQHDIENHETDIIGREIESIETENITCETEKNNKVQFGINQNKENEELEIVDFDLRKAVIYDAVLNPPYIIN